jgi:hypothetical protein
MSDALTNGVKLANMNLLNCTACAFHVRMSRRALSAQSQWRRRLRDRANDSAFPTVATDYMAEYYRLIMKQNVVHLGEAFRALARDRAPATRKPTIWATAGRISPIRCWVIPKCRCGRAGVDARGELSRQHQQGEPTTSPFTVTSGGNPVDSADGLPHQGQR